MRGWLVVMVLGAALGWACGTSEFRCSDDAQCVYSDVQGVCQANQYCTFPDEACPSGQRYAEDVGNGLGGTCLEGDGTSGEETGTASPSGTSTADVTSMGAATVSTTDGATSEATADPDTGSTDDGPPGADPYGECSDLDECADLSGDCVDLGPSEVCTPGCESSSDCPLPIRSPLEPSCVVEAGHPSPGICILPCDADDQCPPGMECAIEGISDFGMPICAWD